MPNSYSALQGISGHLGTGRAPFPSAEMKQPLDPEKETEFLQRIQAGILRDPNALPLGLALLNFEIRFLNLDKEKGATAILSYGSTLLDSMAETTTFVSITILGTLIIGILSNTAVVGKQDLYYAFAFWLSTRKK